LKNPCTVSTSTLLSGAQFDPITDLSAGSRARASIAVPHRIDSLRSGFQGPIEISGDIEKTDAA
jgi:hypothetical protein